MTQAFELGARVRYRDAGVEWSYGEVTSLAPLKVDGLAWDEVEEIHETSVATKIRSEPVGLVAQVYPKVLERIPEESWEARLQEERKKTRMLEQHVRELEKLLEECAAHGQEIVAIERVYTCLVESILVCTGLPARRRST
jgi:hypothetical protein